MGGNGNPNNLPAALKNPQDSIQYHCDSSWSTNKFYWTTLRPFIDNTYGPEISLGHDLKQAYPGEQIALIKYAIGGTSLNAWAPNWVLANAQQSGDATKDSVYKRLFRNITFYYF